MKRYTIPKMMLLALPAFVAELTLFDSIRWMGARIEALLVLACFAALFARDVRQGLWTCWLLGVWKDLGSSSVLGVYPVLFVTLALVLVSLKRVLFREHPLTTFGIVGAAAFMVAMMTALLTGLFQIPLGDVLIRSLASGVLTAIAGVPLLRLLGRARNVLC